MQWKNSHSSQGVVDGRVIEAGVSNTASDRSAVRYSWMDQGYCGYSQRCCSSIPARGSRLKSATRDVNFLRSYSRFRRYVSDLSNVTPRYLGSEQKSKVSLLWLTFSSRLASLLLRWKTADIVFVVLSFSLQVWRYSPTVAMSLLSTPPLPADLHQHVWLLGRQRMYTFWKRCLAS